MLGSDPEPATLPLGSSPGDEGIGPDQRFHRLGVQEKNLEALKNPVSWAFAPGVLSPWAWSTTLESVFFQAPAVISRRSHAEEPGV